MLYKVVRHGYHNYNTWLDYNTSVYNYMVILNYTL